MVCPHCRAIILIALRAIPVIRQLTNLERAYCETCQHEFSTADIDARETWLWVVGPFETHYLALSVEKPI